MATPESQRPSGTNDKLDRVPKAKAKIAKMSWLLLFVGLAALAFAIYIMQNRTEEDPVETITR